MYLQFYRFALAGAVGFVVDVSLLYAMLYLGLGYYLGRVVSFLCAASTTWQINRRLAFAHAAGDNLLHEWARYLLAVLGGGLINYGVYVLCIRLLPATPVLPAFAVAAGSGSGLLTNFISVKFWVFRRGQAG